MKRRAWLQVTSWLLAAVMVGGLLWLMGPARIWRALSGTDPVLVLAAMGCVVLAFVLKGLRWWFIARSLGDVRAAACIRLGFAGMLVNLMVPLVRGGDVGRALVLAREARASRAGALGTVALDKIMDMLGVAFVVAPLIFLGGIPAWIRWPPVATITVAAVLLCAAILLRSRLQGRGEASVPRWLRWTATFAAGFENVRDPATVAIATALTLAVYASLLGSVVLGLASAGIRADLPAGLVVLLAIQFAAGIPLTPAGAGTMHGAVAGVLAATGTDPGAAMGAAIVVHAVQILPLVAIGVTMGRSTALASRAADDRGGSPEA